MVDRAVKKQKDVFSLTTAGIVDREADTVESTDEVSTVPRDEETVARPHLITLYYPPDTLSDFTDKFPRTPVRKPADQTITMGRGVNVDVLLNDTHMPRTFLEVWCEVGQETGPKWYVKNMSTKKPVRITVNGTRTSLKHSEKKEIQDDCELKLESLKFLVKTEDGDIGDMTEFELEIRPQERDSTNSGLTNSARLLNRQTSSSSSGNSLTSATGLARGPQSGQNGTEFQHTDNHFGMPVHFPGLPPVQHVLISGATRSTVSRASTCSCQLGHLPQHHQYSQQGHAGQTQTPGMINPHVVPMPNVGFPGHPFHGGGACSPVFTGPTWCCQPPILSPDQPSLHVGVPATEQVVSPAAMPAAVTPNAEAMPELLSRMNTFDPSQQQSRQPPLHVQASPQQWQGQQQQQFSNFTGHQPGLPGQPLLPNPLHGPQSLPLYRGMDPVQNRPLSCDAGEMTPALVAQPESAAMLTPPAQHQPQNRPPFPHIISTPTTQDTNPQLYHSSNGDLPAAPPITQLDRLKLGYPVQVTTHNLVQAAANSPTSSLSDHGSGSWIAAGGGTSFHQNSRASQAPGPCQIQEFQIFTRETTVLGAHSNASGAGGQSAGAGTPHTEGVGHSAMMASSGNGSTANLPLGASQAVSAPPANQHGESGVPHEVSTGAAFSSLTSAALNGNRVNLRSHDGISATPLPSADFSTMGLDGVADLQERGVTEQEGQGSSREPQENDERQPQEHEDR